MNHLLYTISFILVILVIVWLIGFIAFGEKVGGIIHILLILVIVSFLLRIIAGLN
jgi:hypothetical protein